jgi:hypothetical protein
MAIAISLSIWQVVTQVRTVNAYGFAIGEASNIIPIHLLITKARPPMGAILLKESLQIASTGTLEEGLAGVGIIESNFFPSFFLDVLHKCIHAREMP